MRIDSHLFSLFFFENLEEPVEWNAISGVLDGLEVGGLVGIGEVDGEFEWRMAFVMWESLGSCLFGRGD